MKCLICGSESRHFNVNTGRFAIDEPPSGVTEIICSRCLQKEMEPPDGYKPTKTPARIPIDVANDKSNMEHYDLKRKYVLDKVKENLDSFIWKDCISDSGIPYQILVSDPRLSMFGKTIIRKQEKVNGNKTRVNGRVLGRRKIGRVSRTAR